MEKDISVIIPAYNEALRIQTTIEAIDRYLKEQSTRYEIIVVDDGSTDGTFSVVNDFRNSLKNLIIIRKEKNAGKGSAVKEGVLASKGNLILMSDADLSTPVEEMDKLIFWINNGFDIAIGSRALPESDISVRQPWHREMMGKIFNLLVRLIVLRGFNDTQCGFKLFRGEPARKIFSMSKIQGFSFDVEVLCIAKKLGYKIREVPVRWLNEPHSRVRIVTDPIRMIGELFLIRWRKTH
jgi:dolichyl-phosphate beta-glucosyltransferase